ncbi:MAG TPA: hypothetical protein VFS66_06880 [Acidimicrobiia bacterium]|nr:hypothetical protein [Acidimicrobiia bacterium]
MTAFDARLRILGQRGFPLGVEVDLTDERMVVTNGGQQIADWSFNDIAIYPTASGYRIDAEGEEVILNVTDPKRFAAEIGDKVRQL